MMETDRAKKYTFISYSSRDMDDADALRAFLQEHDFDTWMAPYDIPPGSKYAEVINRAIKDCACCVLLLSDAAQQSVWVAKEIERILNYKKPLFPVCIERVQLNDEFEFYQSGKSTTPDRLDQTWMNCLNLFDAEYNV